MTTTPAPPADRECPPDPCMCPPEVYWRARAEMAEEARARADEQVVAWARKYNAAAEEAAAALTRAEAAEAEVGRLRSWIEGVARVCLGGLAGNVSCRDVHQTPDPTGLGECLWCFACQARGALSEQTAPAPTTKEGA